MNPRHFVIKNVDRIIHCGDPAFGGAMYGCSSCGTRYSFHRLRTITDLLGHSEMSTTEHCYILGYKNMDSLRDDLENVLKVIY